MSRDEINARFNTALSAASSVADSLQEEYGVDSGPANRLVRLIFFGAMAEKLVEGLATGEIAAEHVNEGFTANALNSLFNTQLEEDK